MAKKLFNKAVLGFAVLFAAWAALFCIGSSVTYGAISEDIVPEINFHYYQDGVEVADADHLSAGTYEVRIVLSGLEEVSDIEFTAYYSENVTVNETPVALMSDVVEDISPVGPKLSDGDIVLAFLSDNEDCSAIDANGTVIASVMMTFAVDCDPESEITVSESPFLTLVQVNYADGLDDQYALVTSHPEYTMGTLHRMICDVSPTGGSTVSGSIVIATNSTGATRGVAVYGEYTLAVYSDEDRTQLVTSVTSVMSENDGVRSNNFTINNLKNGTYYATLSSDCAVTRDDLIINVNGNDITGAVIPIVCCDFNHDGVVNAFDTTSVYVAAAGSGDLVYDLNGDGVVNAFDTTTVYVCAAGTINYQNSVIE